MHDADERLETFIDGMNREKVDFVIQLGDFCRPYPKNETFLDIWNRFDGPGHHVLGNHDMDGGFIREETLAFWGTKGKYRSFDLGGYHLVVLDGNDKKEDPWVRYTAPYRDPLFALVTLDPRGAIEIAGVGSQFVPPAPTELSHSGQAHGHGVTASIASKKIDPP